MLNLLRHSLLAVLSAGAGLFPDNFSVDLQTDTWFSVDLQSDDWFNQDLG